MLKTLTAAVATLALATTPVLADDPDRRDRKADTKPASAPHDDVSFAAHMAHHHRDGIAMATHVIEHGSSAAVKKLAERIRSDQQRELTMLDKWASSAGKPKAERASQPPDDPDLKREMARLEATRGAEADALFLELMIAHHASALSMTHAAMPHLQATELRTMASKTFDEQARQIGELQKLRKGGGKAPKAG